MKRRLFGSSRLVQLVPACVGLASLGLLAHCQAPSSASTADFSSADSEIDYRSTAGLEYDVTGTTSITLSSEDAALTGAAKDERVGVLVGDRVDAISQALDKNLRIYWPEEKRLSGQNIAVLLRQSTPNGASVQIAGTTATFEYRIQVAGPNNLLDSLPLETKDGKKIYTLAFDPEASVAVSDAGTSEAGASDAGSTPAAPAAPTDAIDLAWVPAARSLDAFPKYKELFEDGLDIYVHVGGDHNTPPGDLREAEAIFDELKGMGLTGVNTFDELTLDSPPLEGNMQAFGTSVSIRAKLVHSFMAPVDQLDKLVNAFKTNAKTADVVVYKGHAGLRSNYSGTVFHYNPRSSITMDEFKTLDLTDKQQIFLFDGCETYGGYADKLYEHPNKTPENTDIITTGNYSTLHKAETTRALLLALTEKVNGQFRPLSWDTVIKRMNVSNASKWSPIYGVHGLDDNAKLSPLADPAKIGASCSSNADCGALDSLCLKVGTSSVCGAACSDSSGCGTGFTCTQVKTNALPDLSQCVPAK